MIVDANLIEGFKIGFAGGVLCGLILAVALSWDAYKRGFSDAREDHGKP